METKQKKRPAPQRKVAERSSAGKKPVTSGAPQRSTGSRRSEETRRAPERTAQAPRRRSAQETHNVAQQNTFAPHKVEEQVFKTEQKKQRVMNPEAVKRAEQRRKSHCQHSGIYLSTNHACRHKNQHQSKEACKKHGLYHI